WVPCIYCLKQQGQVSMDPNKWCGLTLGAHVCCAACVCLHKTCVLVAPSPALDWLMALQANIYMAQEVGLPCREAKAALHCMVEELVALHVEAHQEQCHEAAHIGMVIHWEHWVLEVQEEEEEEEEWEEEEEEEEGDGGSRGHALHDTVSLELGEEGWMEEMVGVVILAEEEAWEGIEEDKEEEEVFPGTEWEY
ncbi:hypothetical protein FQN50_010033, partial [Emmonsiellopsis sp. PD_5]